MSQNTKKLKILQRGDSSANWTENNPTLRGTEVGFETNTGKYKIGIGDKNQETHWNELPYPAWGAEREIVLSGGATGKITMDGTKNVSLPVTTLQENYLQLSSSSFSGSTSVIGGSTMANFRANRMALYPESAVTFEVSTDGGTTWTEQTGPNKNKVVRQLTMSDQASVNIGTGLEASSGKATVNDQLRVTFDFLNPDGTSNILYCRMQKLFINIGTHGATGAKMKMEYTLIRDPETWVTYQNYSISGWPAWNEMGFGTFGQYVGGATNTNSWRKMRLTFSITGLHNTNSSRLQFRGIMMQAQQCWSKPSTWAEYDAPYRLNMDTGSIYFPGRIDGDISKGANLSKSTGLNATHQNFDTGDTFDFTDKNPNATVLDATLTGNIAKGGRGSYSMSLGGKSAAIGKRSVAEGTTTIAKGAYSHVEGDCSVTLGDDSHAEGYRTVSKGMASHTEGANTMATNSYAHAEGNETLASGQMSHSEGWSTKAIGNSSHAEGNDTIAKGANSHAEGNNVLANGANSHVEGGCNTSGFYAIGSISKKALSASTAALTLKDVQGTFKIGYRLGGLYKDGNNKITLYTPYVGKIIAINNNEITIDTTSAAGIARYNHVYISSNYYETDDTGSSGGSGGDGSTTNPNTFTLDGTYAHVEGIRNIATGNQSHVEGNDSIAQGASAHAEGNSTQARGIHAHAEGSRTLASGADSHAEGYQSEATGTTSHAEGNATQAIGISSHSEGSGTKASGDNSHSEGINTQALGESSHTEGNSNVAEGKNSHAEGYNNSTLGESSHIEGIGNANEAEGAHIEGWQNNATEDAKYSHINGVGLTANTYAQTVIGRWNDSSIPPGDPHILVVGGGTNENNRKNIMTLTSSGDLYCASNIRVGENREELATVNQLIGKSGSGLNSEIFNNYNYNIASGAHSHAEGCGKVENLNSHRGFLVIDRDYSSKTLTLNTTEGLEIGDNIGIGYFDPTGTRISSPSNLKIIDINNNTITISSTIATLYQLPLPLIFIFAVDKDVGSNISGGYSAHAENYGTAKGEFSHAEGFQTSAEGWSSHTEGQNSTALGVGAHSEGYYTYANTKFSHTEGHGAKTGIQGYSVISYDSTNNSFVLNTTAALKIGDIVSASDGKAIDYQYATITAIDKDNKTITVSNASKLTKITTIIGSGTRGDTFIFGQGAHAEGYYTNATSNYSHVQGQYNLNDLECKYAHIVGNGTGISARSNAHTLDWQGNAWFAGDIKVGGTGYDDANAVSIGRSNGTVVYIPFNDIYTAGYTNKWCYYKIGKIDGINSFTKKIFVNNPQKAIISGSADEYHFGTSNIFNLNEWIAVNLYQDSYYYYIKIDNDGNLYACAVYSGSSTSVSFDPTYLYIVPINTFIESPSTIPTVDYTQYILTEIENPTKVEDCLFYSTFTTNNSENIQTYYIDKKISGSVRVLIVDSNDNIIINTIANDTTTSVSTSPTKIPANTELKLYIFGSITKNSNDLRDINFGEIFYATYNNNISQNYLRSYNGITINGNYNSNGQFQNLLEDDRSNIQASDFTKYFNQ